MARGPIPRVGLGINGYGPHIVSSQQRLELARLRKFSRLVRQDIPDRKQMVLRLQCGTELEISPHRIVPHGLRVRYERAGDGAVLHFSQ